MAKILVLNTADRIYRSEGITFKPGQNEIDIDQWAFAQRNKLFKQKVAEGAAGKPGGLKVMAVPSGYDELGQPKDQKKIDAAKAKQAKGEAEGKLLQGDDSYALSELDLNDAKEVISQTADLAMLNRWKEAEADQGKDARKVIVKALDDQIMHLNNKFKTMEAKKSQ